MTTETITVTYDDRTVAGRHSSLRVTAPEMVRRMNLDYVGSDELFEGIRVLNDWLSRPM